MVNYTAKTEKSQDTEKIYKVSVTKKEVKKAENKAVSNLKKDLKIPGFRDGNKIPDEIARKNIPQEKLINEVARIIFSDVYVDLVKKDNLRPFAEPIIEDLDIGFDKDWKFKLIVIQTPTIKLPDYKKIVEEIKKEAKKDEIWLPGKESENKEKEEEKKQKYLNKILDALIEKTKLSISQIFIDRQVKNRIADLVDDIRKAGMKFEEYLSSKQTTAEELKQKYADEIKTAYKIELLLAEIADKENITVDLEEVKKLLKIDTPEKEKQQQEMLYYYAASLRKQKTLEYLTNL
ncbi:MAG: hypothetical protein KatS3mg090_0497 [Patescibacteria group bacterium]|nr:MAG: hypothetical protein KatS3mg090_0497 [Patescibacteria group bacterium]